MKNGEAREVFQKKKKKKRESREILVILRQSQSHFLKFFILYNIFIVNQNDGMICYVF
jgi:hypothetical protein